MNMSNNEQICIELLVNGVCFGCGGKIMKVALMDEKLGIPIKESI